MIRLVVRRDKKVKLAIGFAVLFFATFVRADSQTVTVDAIASSCQCGYGISQPPAINLSAQMTLEKVTGEFFQPALGIFFEGTEWHLFVHPNNTAFN
jgi:hypothetical protein